MSEGMNQGVEQLYCGLGSLDGEGFFLPFPVEESCCVLVVQDSLYLVRRDCSEGVGLELRRSGFNSWLCGVIFTGIDPKVIKVNDGFSTDFSELWERLLNLCA